MSSRTLYLLGGATSFNLLSRGAVTVSSEDSDYPRPYLYDGRSVAPFKFGSVLATQYIEVDLQQAVNGGFELGSGDTFTNWLNNSSGTGSVLQTTTNQAVGARAAAVAGGPDGVGWLEQQYVVRPGERLRLQVKMRGGGGSTAYILIIDRSLGHFWWEGGSWLPNLTNALQEPGTAGPLTHGYYQHSVDFTMPAWSSYQSGLVHLSVVCYVTGEGYGYFDDVVLFPAVSFASVHGHALIPSGMAATLKSTSTAGFGSPTTRAAFAINQPSFYAAVDPTYDRYWRIEISGGQGWDGSTGKPALGEAILGQYDVFDHGPDHPRRNTHDTEVTRAQVRIETGAGDAYVFNRSSQERRALRLVYSGTDTFMRGLVGEIRQRSEGGLYPLVIVPSSTLPDVILGRVDAGYATKRTTSKGAAQAATQDRLEQELLIRELAFPQFAL